MIFWRRRWFRWLAAIVVLVALFRVARKPLLLPKPPRPDDATFAQAKRVRIVRDTYGVPHVNGISDADAAFGLAYAHADDDFPMIQGVLAAATGRLSMIVLSKEALANDYYVGLVRVREQVASLYDTLSADYRAVLEGYARGLNLYAYLHPGEADGRLYPNLGTRYRGRVCPQAAHVRHEPGARCDQRWSAAARGHEARGGGRRLGPLSRLECARAGQERRGLEHDSR